MTDTTVTTEPAAANTPEARTETGELKPVTTPTTTPTAETKASPTSTTPPSTSETKPETKSVAPETYADFTVPEGRTLNKDLISKAVPIFKELGLTQDQAQKLVAFQSDLQVAAEKSSTEAYNATRAGWKSKVLADSTLATGNELRKDVSESIGRVKSVLPAELRGEFEQMLDLTGVGDHPAMVKVIAKIAEFVTEPSHVGGKGPSSLGQKAPGAAEKPSIAKALFPNLPG